MLLASTVVAAQTSAAKDEETAPAYGLRGDDVEATYEAYVKRLGRYQTRLRSHLDADAPDLAETLEKAPPRPVDFGYFIVPKLTVAEPRPPSTPRSAVYSWPWTNRMIDREQTTLSTAEQTLDTVDGMTLDRRRETHEQLTDGYGALGQGQRLVDQHLKHNRFWQQVIAGDWDRFERQRVLHEAVVKRERLLKHLRDTRVTAETTADYDRQIAALDPQIADGQPESIAPRYIQIIENGPRRRVLRVPLYTDRTPSLWRPLSPRSSPHGAWMWAGSNTDSSWT